MAYSLINTLFSNDELNENNNQDDMLQEKNNNDLCQKNLEKFTS